MKKILSLILILAMLFSLGLTPVKAEETFSIAYTLPTRLNETYGKNMPINIGEVKAVFTQAVNPDTISGITFLDSNGNAPKGGIFVSLDETKKIVTVKFGELNPKVTNGFDGVYILTVPATVESESGISFAGQTFDFVTCAQKELINHDFSNTAKWTPGSTYTIPTTEAYFQGGSYSPDYGYFRLWAKTSTASTKGTLKITDNGTLNLINGSSAGDLFMASNFTAAFNAKFVAKWKFKVNSGYTQSGDGFGGLFSGLKTPLTGDGLMLDDLDNGFSKDDDGFYDLTVYASRLETAASGNNVTFENKIDAVDNISKKTAKEPYSSTATGNAVTNKDSADKAIVLSRFAIVKSYRANNNIEFASIKQGFYTIPAPLSEATKAGKTLTYVVNTDIDTASSTATVGDLPATLSYDADTRKLTIAYVGNLTEGQEYDISFKNIVSADGFEGNSVVKYTATESDVAEKTYSVLSNAYTVDSDELTITVPAGTKSAEFKENMIVDGDYVVKDALDAEITQDVILKEGTKLEVENGTVYEVVLDFSTPLVTATKWEFIIDGEASEDLEVFDEVQSVRVTFDAEDFTSIDAGSLNDVTVYETENMGNSVVISNGVFNANTYTFNVTPGTFTAGTSYTLKFAGVKDSVFGRTYDFEKAFTVIDTPHTFNVLYTIPNILTTIKNIGVNQEEIKVYFEEEINPETTSGITFTDSEGNAPKGGIKVSASGKVVTLKFGELKELETYNVAIPATVLSVSGKNAIAKNIEFKTLKKDLANVDFSDSDVWEDGESYTKAELIGKGLPNTFTASKATMTIENGTLKVAMSANDNVYLGSTYSDLATAKIVSFIKSGVPTTTTGNPINNTRLGGLFNADFNSTFPAHIGGSASHFNEGASYGSDIYTRSFVRDSDGFYDLTVISQLIEKSVSDDLSKKKVGTSWKVLDNLSDFSRVSDITDREYTVSTTVRTKAAAAFKFYHANTLAIKSIRQGFYTIPAPFGDVNINNETKTITAVMNTDIDAVKSTAIVDGNPATLAFDSATRALTVTYAEALLENKKQDIVINFVSVDGLKGEIKLSYGEPPAITSETYVIDNDALTIAGVVPGTTKAQLLEKLNFADGITYEVKDANGTTIADATAVLKGNTKVVLANGKEYALVFNFEGISFITDNEYKFIMQNGTASIDETNVYDSITGIKVSFNVTNYTTIDAESFNNNVSIYETANSENTVAIASASFENNVYTINIAEGALTAGKSYTLKFTNIKDRAFEKEHTFEKQFTVVATPVPTYTIESSVYTVAGLEISGVVPGTTKEQLLDNLTISCGYTVKDANEDEITDLTAVLKNGTTITLENGDIYTVIFDFTNPLVSATKYEFIADDAILDDVNNVYDSASQIKVAFSASDLTTIDAESFNNNVSIYETQNPTNVVAIASANFVDNVYTINVADGALTAGKSYTIKFTNIKETTFGQEYTIEKAFTVIATPPKPFDISYTIPTQLQATYGKNIAVNQGEIKVVFAEKIASGIENITFKDSEGNAPKGGVYVSLDETKKILTVKFGELKVSTTYNLELPASILGESGKNFVGKTLEFKTVAQKDLTVENFSDTTKWTPDTTYSLETGDKAFTTLNPSASSLFRVFMKDTATVSNTTLKVTPNGTLSMVNSASKTADRILGSAFTRLSNINVVTVLKFKANSFNGTGNGFGGLFYDFNNSVTGAGLPLSNMSDFSKDVNGFYDVTLISKRNETSVSESNIKFDYSIKPIDNISGSVGTVFEGTNTYASTANQSLHTRAGIIKSYTAGSDIEFASIKQGFYTIPAFLNGYVFDEETKTIKGIVNTDIDLVSLSNVKVGLLPATATFNSETRELTITYTGDLRNGIDYIVNLTDLSSADGIKFANDITINNGKEKTEFVIAQTNPDSQNAIGVNQGKIEIVFDVEPTTAEGITLKDNSGNTPIGGVKVSKDGAKVTLEFGELAPSAEYTVVIPTGLVGVDGKTYYEDAPVKFTTLPKSEAHFTVPAPISGPVWDEATKTVKYIMNTDIDVNASNIKIGNLPTTSAFNPETRELTLTYGGNMIDGYDYTVTFTELVSVDGKAGSKNEVFNNGKEYSGVNVLYTIPNMMKTSGNIGVNQGKIDIVFTEELASGVENITFKDSLGNEPVGGVKITKDGVKITLEFGELKEEETYTLYVPETIVSIDGSVPPTAETFTYKTLKKDLTNADFSDSTVWENGTYTKEQIAEKGLPNTFTASKTTMTVADGKLNVAMSATDDVYFGATHSALTTSKVVSIIKFQEPSVKTGDNASNLRIGGVWYNGFNSNFPAHVGGSASRFFEGASYLNDIVASGCKADENGYYDLTVTTELIEKTVSADLTTKTIGVTTTIKDNASDTVKELKATDRKFDIGTTVKTNATSAFKLYYKNTFNIKSIRQGFYTVPAPLGLPVLDVSGKTITYVMNTDIDVSKSSITFLENPTELEFNSETRELTIAYTGDIIEGEEYKINFANVVSKDGLKGSGESRFSTVLLTVISANPMSGSKIKAEAGTMTFVFSDDVTKEDVEANVTFFKKETGEIIPVTFTVAEDERTVEMTYPALLNSTEYVLKMPKTFVFDGLEYLYTTTGSNSIKSMTPYFNFGVSNSVSPYLGVIKVEFNNPVTLDMVKQHTALKLTSDISINITEENGVFSVWLPVLEAGKTYTFSISDILLEERCGIMLDVQTPMQNIKISPTAGGTIDVNQREITITFEKDDYSLAELQNAISFVDDDGDTPIGGVYIRKDSTDPKKAILRFGQLDEYKHYQVIINSLKDADDIIFNYMTSGRYALDVDFDDWETGVIEKPETGAAFSKGGLILGHASGKLAESDFQIKNNPVGESKYLQIKATKKSKNVAVGYKFPSEMMTGKFIVDMGIKEGSTTVDGFKNSATSVLTHSNGTTPGGGTSVDALAITSFTSFEKNENGFYKVKATLTKTAETSSILYESENNLSTSLDAKSFTSGINSVAFLKMYSNGAATDTLNLDYVKAYFVKDLEAINTLDGFDPKNKQFEIVFSEDVDETTLTELELTSASHNVKLNFVSYSDRKAIFDLSEHLNYGTDYEISVKKVKGTGEFEMMTETPVKFKTMLYSISAKDEVATGNEVAVTLENRLSEDRDYNVSIVLYDAKDRVVGAKALEDKIEAGATIPVSFTIDADIAFADYKIYIWDITNEYYIPVK